MYIHNIYVLYMYYIYIYIYIYVIMNTFCPPGCHHNGYKCHCGDNRGGGHIIFMITYIYYAHLASLRFEHFVCRGLLMTTYLMLLA